MNNFSNYTEFEAKFYPIKKQEYRSKLLTIGAKLVSPERLMRRSIADHESHPQFTCDYVRVRDEGDTIRLSSKINAREGGNLSDQKEIDVTVSDFDKTVKIIESMGIHFNRYQETLRETWQYEGAEITIDTWPGLETYTEIEAKSEEQVQEIALKLQLNWEAKIITSVAEIYMKIYHLTMQEILKKISFITFEKNPFNPHLL